jgi:hypothetical protein
MITKYPNECVICGKPKVCGDMCRDCLSSPVYCITGLSDNLGKIIRNKRKEGLSPLDNPLKIGGGYFVQKMVFKGGINAK